MQGSGKVDHIPGSAAAEAIVAAVHFHAGRSVIVKWTACHAISPYPYSIVRSSLPGSDGLLHRFKHIQMLPPVNVIVLYPVSFSALPVLAAAAAIPGQRSTVLGAFSLNPPEAAYTAGTAWHTPLAAGHIPVSMRPG